MSYATALEEYWIEEPPTRVLLRLFLDYKPPRKRTDYDRKVMSQIVGGRPKKLSKAPKYLREAAEQLKKEAKDNKGNRGRR